MTGPVRAGIAAKLYIMPVQWPSFFLARCAVSAVVYVQLRMFAMLAGGHPMTVPENRPKMTQKPMAAASELASGQAIRTRREQMICAALCMLSAPMLSEKWARSMRPMVEAPFMMVSSQKVSMGLLVGSAGVIFEVTPSRVP
jgi:hypothetical protein